MEKNMIDNMIAWAKSRIGCPDYAGWCLSFIEDALEISNDIEFFRWRQRQGILRTVPGRTS